MALPIGKLGHATPRPMEGMSRHTSESEEMAAEPIETHIKDWFDSAEDWKLVDRPNASDC